MNETKHVSRSDLEAGLEHIRQSPKDKGIIRLIVRRPAVDAREVVEVAELSMERGLTGDTWMERPSRHTSDHSPSLQAQVTLMNSRAAELIAGGEERWALAGDQFYVDMDLGEENLPVGTRLGLGSAVLEISSQPHLGCAKFSQRFGVEAHKFVNSAEGKPLRLRGVNARVLQAGTVRAGDVVRKLS